MDIDSNRVEEVVLALLWLNVETSGTAWKGFDWQAMERLHERGLISNPVGKTKSVQLSEAGRLEGQRLCHALFASGGRAKGKG